MSRVFFVADLHLNHSNIIKYCNRPFLTDRDRQALEENGGTWHEGEWKGTRASRWRITAEATELMDQVLIDNINKTVAKDDWLWVLGDFVFARKDVYYEKCREYRDRIVCQNVNLVWGNHDNRRIWDLFCETYDLVTLQVPTTKARIVLCHFPLAVWDGSHRGNIHLYGHSHSGSETWLDQIMPDRRAMDVGVDNAVKILGEYRPFSLEEIQNRLMPRLGYGKRYHHQPTEESVVNGQST